MFQPKIKVVVLLGLLIAAGGGEVFAQTRVLVLGGTQPYQSGQEAAFLTASVATNLQAILAGDLLVSQPVTVQNTDTYQSDGTANNFSSRTLMSWYYWPANHAATLALLSNNWNYVVMVDDPHVASTFPEYHLEGVMRISQQVQASGATPVSVMTWSSGTNALSKFGEMAYRVGDGLGVAVAPAGYAWNNVSDSLKDAGTRPTARGAYVTAATVYSRLYNRSATNSTYIPDGMMQAERDALADVAFTTVQNEATNTHYSGTLRRPTHFAASLVKDRKVTFAYWQSSTENRISDRLVTCFGVLRTAQSQPYTTSYQTWPDVLTPVDFGYSRFSSGYPSLVKNYSTFDYEDDSGATTMVTGMDRVMYPNPPSGWEQETGAASVTDSKMDLGEFFVPLRVLWARIHEAQPQIELQTVADTHHMIEPVNNGIAAMMTTLLTGRCPIGDEPAYDPNATSSYAWQDWFCRKMGYEVAMQHAALKPQLHGFVVLPSSSSKIFLKPGASETMPVQFRYAPASNVTVNVTCNQSGAVVLSQTNLTFTPANYATVQNVVVDLAPGALPVGPMTLSFDTQSADPAFNAVHDEWTYYAVPRITGFTNTLIGHTRLGTLVGTVTTVDDTSGLLKFSIVGGNSNGVFAINSGSGNITVAGDLDPATQSLYNLAVLATDNGTPASIATNYVQIAVIANGSPSLPGTISYAVYDGIGSGTAVSDLTNNARFPTDPNWEKQITSAEGDTGRGDNYGSVLRGYLIPPVSGNYNFFIAADDSAELWMSTSSNPASMTLIANVPSWTNPRQWTQYASQSSATQALVAGQAYYIEARQKEGAGGDNLAVGWVGPATAGQTNVISALYLAPYFANYVPYLTGFTNTVSRYALAGARIGQMTVTDVNSNDLYSFTILSGDSAGIFGVDSNGWVYVADTNALASTVTTNFTLSIRTTDNGTPALSATNSATITLVESTPPTVSVIAATGVTTNAASLQGRVDFDGGATLLGCGFFYGYAPGITTDSIKVSGMVTRGTNTWITPGTTNWVCPPSVTNITVECWGGGGAGGSATRAPGESVNLYGGGGAGGAYAKKVVTVSYPNTYTVTVGAGGVAVTNLTSDGMTVPGGDSWFNDASPVLAKGGAGGTCAYHTNVLVIGAAPGGAGSTNGCIGDTVYAGGRGANGWGGANPKYGGGGGGSGGTGSNGNSAANFTGAAAVTGGGAGGNGAPSANKGGTNAPSLGGGGGGGFSSSAAFQKGGNGYDGQVRLTCQLPSGAALIDYTMINLTPNAAIYYRAYASNSVGLTLSSETNFFAPANVPAVPDLSTNAAYSPMTSMTVKVNPNGNPGYTEYAIQETNSGLYVQANNTLGTSAVWQTTNQWHTFLNGSTPVALVTNLTPGTTYGFRVKARNGNNVETAFSPAAVFTTAEAPATYTLTVNSGTGDGSYTNGQQVAIEADTFVYYIQIWPPVPQMTFDAWTGDIQYVANIHSSTTTVTMPPTNIAVTATYKEVTNSPPVEELTVISGTVVSVSYPNVVIAAHAPAAGKTFDRWAGDVAYVANIYAPITTVVLPPLPPWNITLTATYKLGTFELTASAGAGGTITPTTTNVTPNTDASFTITADTYCRIAGVFTNGADTGLTFNEASTSYDYIWPNVQAAGAVYATFQQQVTTNCPAPVPYEWLARYFVTNDYNAAANADQDGDGLTAWQEYITGTIPNNATSCFKAAQNTRNTITWSSVSGRVYSVYWTTNLVNGFQPLETNIPWTQGSFTNLNPGPRVNLYQIKVRMQ